MRFSESAAKPDAEFDIGGHIPEREHPSNDSVDDFVGTPDLSSRKPLDELPLPTQDATVPERSSAGQAFNNPTASTVTRRVCATEGEAKNLVAAETETKKQAAGDIQTTEIKALLFNYAWWLKKQGYAESTIEGWTKILRILSKRGVNLDDPESLKDGIARQEWSLGRKENAVDAYTSLLGMHGQKWNPPMYKRVSKLPFIPQETEIDQLIAINGKKVAAFLQLLKETGARSGEVWSLKWIDIDFENRAVNITPEKGSNPRHLRISTRLITMLNELPREGQKIWMARNP